MKGGRRALVLGYGNSLRGDDGLGPALVGRLAPLEGAGVTLRSVPQLSIEDALFVASHDPVVFVDASTSCRAPFEVGKVVPDPEADCTLHRVAPAAVLALARDLYGAEPEALMVSVRGEEFEGFREGISPRAAANLDRAAAFLERSLGGGARAFPRP